MKKITIIKTPKQEVLTKDEIENCIYNAVWNALEKFDESRGVKFSTFLHI